MERTFPKKRVLITGASGLLGSNLAVNGLGWEILGLFNTHAVNIPGVDLAQVDLLNNEALKTVVAAFKPQVIIHAAALADIELCESNKEMAHAFNVTATENVCRMASDYGSHVVYISTDAVYDGERGHYSEDDNVNPVNHYAATKILGEEVALRFKGNLVVRTSFYGFNVQPKTCLPEWAISQWLKGQTINGFTDIISSNIYTGDLRMLVKEALNKNLSGVYNVACSSSLSKYDFLKELSEYLNIKGHLTSSMSMAVLKTRRGKNLSLNVDKLQRALGHGIIDAKESLGHFCRDYKDR